MSASQPDATHAQGCSKLLARPSQLLPRHDFCPECKRLVTLTRPGGVR